MFFRWKFHFLLQPWPLDFSISTLIHYKLMDEALLFRFVEFSQTSESPHTAWTFTSSAPKRPCQHASHLRQHRGIKQKRETGGDGEKREKRNRGDWDIDRGAVELQNKVAPLYDLRLRMFLSPEETERRHCQSCSSHHLQLSDPRWVLRS